MIRNILYIAFERYPLEPALGSTPVTLDHVVGVHPREEVLLEVPERATGLTLVNAEPITEGLLGLTTILELSKEDLAVLGQKWARGVSIVGGIKVLALHGLKKVADEDGRLGGNSSGSLGGRQT